MDTRPWAVEQKLFAVLQTNIGPYGKTLFFSQEYLIYATALDGSAPFDEAIARTAADKFHHYLTAAHSAGISDLTPGHFLLSGELTGSPVLTFAHICQPKTGNRKSLWREMERLYDAYKAKVVHPFFQKRFLPYQLSNCIDPSFEHPA